MNETQVKKRALRFLLDEYIDGSGLYSRPEIAEEEGTFSTWDEAWRMLLEQGVWSASCEARAIAIGLDRTSTPMRELLPDAKCPDKTPKNVRERPLPYVVHY